jgi:succinate dehydrogenase / fumarate reductase iron-sulfur subunit
MQVNIDIERSHPGRSPWVQTYSLTVESGTTILDCLNQIKWEQDGSLAFRKNCRNTICGSCAITLNGRSALACKENVGQESQLADPIVACESTDELTSLSAITPRICIAPLRNFPVIKDLVVDMQSFWQGLATVDPQVHGIPEPDEAKESCQPPALRAAMDPMGNCILCGACYAACNAIETNPTFVGPHALAKAHRLVLDNRDAQPSERLASYGRDGTGVWGCTRCFNCNTVCPMGVEPLTQITQLKTRILANPPNPNLRAVRHRQGLLELVQAGGWVDERQFGLRVVGDRFRDFAGLWSLVPLGLRMVRRGKFPWRFEPSAGTKQVRSLIQSVLAISGKSSKSDQSSNRQFF